MNCIMYTRLRLHVGLAATMRGFTLVELMVAMTIGLIILGAVAQIFVTSRSTFALEGDLARLQENGRFAMEFIGQDVRMSGNLGCLQKYSVLAGTIVDPVTNQLNNNTDYGWDFSAGQHLRGHANNAGGTALAAWAPPLPGDINGLTYFTAGEVSEKTDVLVIRRAMAQSFKLSQATTAAGPVKIPDPGTTLNINEIVLITDCNGGDIFQITGITNSGPDVDLAHAGGGGPGNVATDLSRSYGINSEVSKVVTRIYYVGPGTDSVTPTLYRKDISSGAVNPVPSQPLVDNVEAMRVLFGEDTDAPSDNQANIYQQANSVANWTDVVSVRIALLVRTAENSGPDFDTNTYNLAGGGPAFDPDPDDRRQRRVFTSTIQLRNPIP